MTGLAMDANGHYMRRHLYATLGGWHTDADQCWTGLVSPLFAVFAPLIAVVSPLIAVVSLFGGLVSPLIAVFSPLIALALFSLIVLLFLRYWALLSPLVLSQYLIFWVFWSFNLIVLNLPSLIVVFPLTVVAFLGNTSVLWAPVFSCATRDADVSNGAAATPASNIPRNLRRSGSTCASAASIAEANSFSPIYTSYESEQITDCQKA